MMEKPEFRYIEDVIYDNVLYELWNCKYDKIGYDFLFFFHRNSRDIYLNVWEFKWNVARLKRGYEEPIRLDYGDFYNLRDFTGYDYIHHRKRNIRKYNPEVVKFKKFFHRFLKPINSGRVKLPRIL